MGTCILRKTVIRFLKKMFQSKCKKWFVGYGKQYIDRRDISAVTETLKSDFLTQGPKVEEFEQSICKYTGARFCVAVSSGTAALHIAVAALKLPVSSEGITSTNTFVASANALVYCGVKPVFSDIDLRSYNMSVEDLKKRISRYTTVIVPVHFAGQIADMEQIGAFAKERNIHLIEDGSHSLGSLYPNGSQYGNCEYADMCTFSFHPVKTITTGEGGAVTTNRSELYERLLMLRSHGITKDEQKMGRNDGPWYYEMQELGFNYRMTDIQAAMGITQLRKLEFFRSRRREIWEKYNRAFADLPWMKCPEEIREGSSCFHLYVARIEFGKLGMDRKTVMQRLREQGVGTQVHYIPVHQQPYYKKYYPQENHNFPAAEAYYRSALSLPLHPRMTERDQQRVVDAIRRLA